MILGKRKRDFSRRHFNTTLSKELLDEIREIARERKIPYGHLLEEGMQWSIENVFPKKGYVERSRPIDRVRINTTFKSSLFAQVKNRSKAIGKGVFANDLIEEGMRHIIEEKRETSDSPVPPLYLD